jgi:hypothetical protein
MVATGFGAYGAANSIYYHFLARGHDVVYPKDMGMVIGLWGRARRITIRRNQPSPNPRSRLRERGIESESDFAGGRYSA